MLIYPSWRYRPGGFPEALGLGSRDRASLLSSYVDVAVLRDVIERPAVSNPLALRWMERHLLGNAATSFSAQKFLDSLKSQGIPVGKDTVHAYLGHLEDAFIIRTASLHTASERQRMVNPRKAYPDVSDPAIHNRETRALTEASGAYPEAVPILLTLESIPPLVPCRTESAGRRLQSGFWTADDVQVVANLFIS